MRWDIKTRASGEFYMWDRKSPLHKEGDKQLEKWEGEGI